MGRRKGQCMPAMLTKKKKKTGCHKPSTKEQFRLDMLEST